ncbi:MAG TPA: glycosyl hydrolase family 17 protein [Candidatus Krumholzibacteria bacterium]|nr:glycosyl hydrolase family 17 protein [Candidatus Krumholzibacteria bacterium]
MLLRHKLFVTAMLVLAASTAAADAPRPWPPGGRSVGPGVCYGPHRDGQRPGGPDPTEAQLREDLHLIARHWGVLRLYGAGGPGETVLRVIRADSLGLKVVLGVWIAPEEHRDADGRVLERFPAAAAANAAEVDAAIRLAAAYPDVVAAVCVGNETQVSWSAHRSPLDILIGHVRRVRGGVAQPVSVADDFNFWNKPASRALAAEVDFVIMHAHPMWNGLQRAEALPWLDLRLAEVRALHPDRPVVLGETGWATSVAGHGEQAQLIKGTADEAEQAQFAKDLRGWADAKSLAVFLFEAFDENWKGGDDPAEVEKHWGVYGADRAPKPAVAALEAEDPQSGR